MTEITYVIGDATQPQGSGLRIIAHVCNDIGAWGAGFVLALSRRWPTTEQHYRQWYLSSKRENDFALGDVQFVSVERTITVANMVAQRGVRHTVGSSLAPIRYDALEACLKQVGVRAGKSGASVHMPRIGCGLAGGSWAKVEPIIRDQVCRLGVAVTVYDLEFEV